MQREQGVLVGESMVGAEAGEPGGPNPASLSHGHLCNVLLIQFVPGNTPQWPGTQTHRVDDPHQKPLQMSLT